MRRGVTGARLPCRGRCELGVCSAGGGARVISCCACKSVGLQHLFETWSARIST